MERKYYNILPENWKPGKLSMCEIFVFESKLEGEHDEGDAKTAYEQYGAEWGVGVGRSGKSYAIPTNLVDIDEEFRPFVEEFISYVKSHPHNRFLLPRIRCEQSCFDEEDIIPLFEECFDLINVQMSEEWAAEIALIKIDAMEGKITRCADRDKAPSVMDENVLQSLCDKYKYEIATGITNLLPWICIRYVIDTDKFGYAMFGDFFFLGEGENADLYVWLYDDKYAEDHDQDVVEVVMGDECRGRGYAVRMIFAGIRTGYKDSNGRWLFTGDVVEVKEKGYLGPVALASRCDLKEEERSFYGFPLDNHSLTLDMCKEMNLHLTSIGTVFFQLDRSEWPVYIWRRAIEFNNWNRNDKEVEAQRVKARYTPNFDKENWKYFALDTLGVEFNWDK